MPAGQTSNGTGRATTPGWKQTALQALPPNLTALARLVLSAELEFGAAELRVTYNQKGDARYYLQVMNPGADKAPRTAAEVLPKGNTLELVCPPTTARDDYVRATECAR